MRQTLGLVVVESAGRAVEDSRGGGGRGEAGQGVVPFLPLTELGRMNPATGAATTGGTN